MVVSALYLLAGCAFFGGAQQFQLSMSASGRRAVVHGLLFVMWLALALLALGNALYISHSGPSGMLSYEFLIRFTLAAQFSLWMLLIWLVVAITGVHTTLIPVVLSGVWVFLTFISIRLPLELFIATLPQQSSGAVSGPINGWWVSIYFIILVTFGYTQYAVFQYFSHGQRSLSRLLAGSLILLLETSIYDLLVTLRLIHSPTITVFGFLAVLLAISFYLLMAELRENRAPVTTDSKRPGQVATGIKKPPLIQQPETRATELQAPVRAGLDQLDKTLTAIDLYAGMGIRRLRRGVFDAEKLATLFRKVQSEAGSCRSITARLTGKKTDEKPERD